MSASDSAHEFVERVKQEVERDKIMEVFKAWFDKYEPYSLWHALPDAFAAGAAHGGEIQREACAKRVELWGSHFQRLKESVRYAETKECCRCMIDNLKSLAEELRKSGGKA